MLFHSILTCLVQWLSCIVFLHFSHNDHNCCELEEKGYTLMGNWAAPITIHINVQNPALRLVKRPSIFQMCPCLSSISAQTITKQFIHIIISSKLEMAVITAHFSRWKCTLSYIFKEKSQHDWKLWNLNCKFSRETIFGVLLPLMNASRIQSSAPWSSHQDSNRGPSGAVLCACVKQNDWPESLHCAHFDTQYQSRRM